MCIKRNKIDDITIYFSFFINTGKIMYEGQYDIQDTNKVQVHAKG